MARSSSHFEGSKSTAAVVVVAESVSGHGLLDPLTSERQFKLNAVCINFE